MSFPELKWNAPVRPDGPAGEPEGLIFHPDMFDNHASLVILAKDVMDLLHRHYPGHAWAVQINEFGRMLNIFNTLLHPVWGYTIRASDIMDDPRREKAVLAGGEILERFGLKRGMLDMEAYNALPKDPRGNCFPILSGLETAAAKKELRKRALDEAIDAGRTFIDEQGRVIVGVKH
jgi:hypothetical protein